MSTISHDSHPLPQPAFQHATPNEQPQITPVPGTAQRIPGRVQATAVSLPLFGSLKSTTLLRPLTGFGLLLKQKSFAPASFAVKLLAGTVAGKLLFSFTRKGKSDVEGGNITPPGIPPPSPSDDTAVEPEHPRGCLSTVATYMQWIISLQILCVEAAALASFSSVVAILIGQQVLKSEHSAFDVTAASAASVGAVGGVVLFPLYIVETMFLHVLPFFLIRWPIIMGVRAAMGAVGAAVLRTAITQDDFLSVKESALAAMVGPAIMAAVEEIFLVLAALCKVCADDD
ncbi:uncharacterized protein SCHCODRAFT_02591685 [Schizophyllum commune H4-8]|uniref:Uncharacterized protein n=1 Tax=Schizophyllum commune (strain H4-8 / FGSC 9210) TaxID=578458 RepID=D8QJ83_SCHCM|nr:uncharacterized protein SCHCODRAFT_02591685 [Schizophyllum commune H4-8]KAI5886443.1 hypothetical protein SCHCODRAFT_02591685 [Schizophyllum commune H4-8]